MHNHGILALKGTNGIGDPAHLLENVIFLGENQDGRTLLHNAVLYGGNDIVKLKFSKRSVVHFGEFNVQFYWQKYSFHSFYFLAPKANCAFLYSNDDFWRNEKKTSELESQTFDK